MTSGFLTIFRGGGVGGIYLRKCVNVTLQNIFYTSTDTPVPTALDIDESSSNLVLINAFFNAGSVSTGKLVKTFGVNWNPSTARSRVIEVYDQPNNPQREGIVIYGTQMWCHSGRLANNTALDLPVVGSGMPNKVGTILVSATDGDALLESGYFMIGRGDKAVLVAGTKRMEAVSAQGKLCLVPGSTMQLVNNLGADVDVVVTIYWNQ